MTTLIIVDLIDKTREEYKEPTEGDDISVDGRIYTIVAVSEWRDTWIVQGMPVGIDHDGTYQHYGYRPSGEI